MERAGRRVIRIVGPVVAVLAAGPAWPAAPAVSFEEQAVVATGVTSGGGVAVFGVSRGFNGFTGYVLRHDEVLADADGDGSVRLELGLPVSLRSVFSVVDLASGEVGLGVPEGFELRVSALPPEAIGADGSGWTEPRRRLYALWVRPGGDAGAGVWGANFGDGGATDGDGAEDGVVHVEVSSFVPTEPGESAPPERLESGDVLVVIDVETLEIAAIRLSG